MKGISVLICGMEAVKGQATEAQDMKIRNYGIQPNRLEKNRDTLRQKTAWGVDSQDASQPVSGEPSSFNLEINQVSEGYSALKADNARAGSDPTGQDARVETNLRLIESLVYQMLGKRIKLQVKQSDASGQQAQLAWAMSPVQERDSWGLVYEYQEAVSEQHSIQFNSGGTVTTSEGRTLAFSLEFSMSRAYYEQNGMAIQLDDTVQPDPFAVMMESRLMSLSSGKAAGEGYTELCAYDLDHNGWIGEADDVCGRLSILPLSEKGDKTLIRLADVGIGAIYLQEVDTPYEAGDAAEIYGDFRGGSAYLRDNSRTGVHHIDLKL